MVAFEREPRKFTPEEYLTVERMADYRSEYVDGQIYAMAGASTPHIVINWNVGAAFHSQLKGSGCFAGTHDMKVGVGKGTAYHYPDLFVVCGEPRYHDAQEDVLLNPVVLIEILSPSTERVDRILKLDCYQQIESLRDYVLITQDAPRIEVYSRNAEGGWTQRAASGLDAKITLTGVDVTLEGSEIYEGIAFVE